MAVKKQKKTVNQNFGIFEWILAQNPTNQDSQLTWFSRPYERLLENPKTWGSKELIWPGNYSKTCVTVKSR